MKYAAWAATQINRAYKVSHHKTWYSSIKIQNIFFPAFISLVSVYDWEFSLFPTSQFILPDTENHRPYCFMTLLLCLSFHGVFAHNVQTSRNPPHLHSMQKVFTTTKWPVNAQQSWWMPLTCSAEITTLVSFSVSGYIYCWCVDLRPQCLVRLYPTPWLHRWASHGATSGFSEDGSHARL